MPDIQDIEARRQRRARRRLRLRRHSRRAYIRSVYFLPSMATLGNAICGFGAIYVVQLDPNLVSNDPLTQMFTHHRFVSACLLILLAMLFDALDGRLARWTRHTTDFGGQLDSMADVISFGAAPGMIAIALFKDQMHDAPLFLGRLMWAIGAIYMSCAAIRLARFNVSNEHGEQAHMSFLGLPSPGAAAAVIGMVMVQNDLASDAAATGFVRQLAIISVWLLPVMVLSAGLLMISHLRYGHLINQYLRGKRGIGRLIGALLLVMLIIVAPRYTIGLASILYALSAPIWWMLFRWRRRDHDAVARKSQISV